MKSLLWLLLLPFLLDSSVGFSLVGPTSSKTCNSPPLFLASSTEAEPIRKNNNKKRQEDYARGAPWQGGRAGLGFDWQQLDGQCATVASGGNQRHQVERTVFKVAIVYSGRKLAAQFSRNCGVKAQRFNKPIFFCNIPSFFPPTSDLWMAEGQILKSVREIIPMRIKRCLLLLQPLWRRQIRFPIKATGNASNGISQRANIQSAISNKMNKITVGSTLIHSHITINSVFF